jgi:HAD superfamily hydrolase (TIGR01509 family)
VIRAIVFDLDGTMVDTEKTALQSWQELYDAAGLKLPLELWRTTIGTWDAEFDPVTHLAEHRGHALSQRELEDRMRREWELAAQLPLRPGVLAHIEAAEKAGLALGIASSSSKEWVRAQLGRFSLLDRFECVCTRDDVPATKPDPALYVRALICLGVDGSEALAYEDSPNGLLAARAAGMHCVVVPGILTAEAEFPHADAILDTLAGVDPRALWDAIAAEDA